MDKTKSEFTINQSKGFTLKFANGYYISVQFGAGNYCDNYRASFDAPKKTDKWKSATAEIAIWKNPDKPFKTKDFGFSDDVEGYLTADEVAELINKVRGAK